jgi:hypothetical protein
MALSQDIGLPSPNNSLDIGRFEYLLLNSNSLPNAQAKDKDRKSKQAESQ